VWLSSKGFCSLELLFLFFLVVVRMVSKQVCSFLLYFLLLLVPGSCENLSSFEFREAGDPAELLSGIEREREA
jgi:hypothetical protein